MVDGENDMTSLFSAVGSTSIYSALILLMVLFVVVL
jgi:hypothetical protein